jgi:hypothetical protein
MLKTNKHKEFFVDITLRTSLVLLDLKQKIQIQIQIAGILEAQWPSFDHTWCVGPCTGKLNQNFIHQNLYDTIKANIPDHCQCKTSAH